MRLLAANLGIDRGGRRVVSGVTFALASGEALVVTGENGSGKSTLLRALAGLLRPAEGRVTYEEVERDDPPLHYVGHRDGLKPQLTVAENLSFAAAWFGNAGPALAPAAAIARLGLAPAVLDTPAGWLSTGQRRRAALARLLVAPRPLWLLDEPTSGLDTATVTAFEAVAAAHLSGGGLLVAASHLPLRLSARELRLEARG